ncbi:methyltransferase dimerization domain-containing protein [Streptomyces sp. M19]
MSSSTEADPVYQRFHFLVNAPALFNAVATAVELNIFAFLARSPGAGFEQIRAETGVPAHQLRVLLQAVCATGLLERRTAATRTRPPPPNSSPPTRPTAGAISCWAGKRSTTRPSRT